jgi:hypothetical protein
MHMKRVWGHVVAGVTFVVGGIVAIAACKHDDSTLFVQDVLEGQPVTAGELCSFTADPTQPFISSGVLDIALRSGYSATYLLGNQAVPEVNSQQLQTETNIITVQGAVVRVTDTFGVQQSTFTRLAAATLYPSSGSLPGYAPITIEILDAPTLSGDAFLQATVLAGGIARLVTYVTFFGVTTGGDSVQSDAFEFPVDVCDTCLIGFSAADENPLEPEPNCLVAASSTTASSLPAPCVPGQDSVIDCSQCLEFAACHGKVPAGTVVVDAGGQ